MVDALGSLVWTLIVILLRKRNVLLHKFQPNSAFSHYTSQPRFDFVFFFLIVCLTVFDYRSSVDLCVRNMDSKGDDGSREMLLKLQEKIEKATSELKASGSYHLLPLHLIIFKSSLKRSNFSTRL